MVHKVNVVLFIFNHNKKNNIFKKHLLLAYHTQHCSGDMTVNKLKGHCPHQRGSAPPPSPTTQFSFQATCPLSMSCTFTVEYKFLKGRGLDLIHLVSLELNTMLNMWKLLKKILLDILSKNPAKEVFLFFFLLSSSQPIHSIS